MCTHIIILGCLGSDCGHELSVRLDAWRYFHLISLEAHPPNVICAECSYVIMSESA